MPPFGFPAHGIFISADALIVAPGPTVNELSHCITAVKGDTSKNITMVWFGVTLTPWYIAIQSRYKYGLFVY